MVAARMERGPVMKVVTGKTVREFRAADLSRIRR
jgi:hypothetical protein